jgi:DNA-binding GntR family transcriptional regulator
MDDDGGSMMDGAYGVLKADILTGRIPGGTLWSDREIASRLAVSRTPIREAVQRLAAEGLVEVIPRRGTRVLPLRVQDVREIHQIAKALELEAATILAVAERRDLKALSRAVDDMDAALMAEDRDAWGEADARFHHATVEACGNARLAQLYDGQRALTDRARYFALHLRETPRASAADHRAMLEAIEARRVNALAALYRDHWDRTTEELLELVRRHGAIMPIDEPSREERR